MFNSLRRWFVRRRYQSARRSLPRIKPVTIRRTKPKKSPLKWLIDLGLIGAWSAAIIYNPNSMIVSALSITLISAAVRRIFSLQPGLFSDLMHPVLDIGAFALATGAWLWAREFVLAATVIGVPKVTAEIEERYHAYA